MITATNFAKYDGALTDIYSFGVLMWTTMSLQKPYQKIVRQQRMNLWQLREHITTGKRPEVDGNEALENAPAAAIELMKRCWHQVPQERPASFDEVKQQLASILEETSFDKAGNIDRSAALVREPSTALRERGYSRSIAPGGGSAGFTNPMQHFNSSGDDTSGSYMKSKKKTKARPVAHVRDGRARGFTTEKGNAEEARNPVSSGPLDTAPAEDMQQVGTHFTATASI